VEFKPSPGASLELRDFRTFLFGPTFDFAFDLDPATLLDLRSFDRNFKNSILECS
jgi:hypothetical protein